MIAGHDTTRENLTLTDAELAACKPVAGEGGHVLRALCPFHGSDHQRRRRVPAAAACAVPAAPGATSQRPASAGVKSSSDTTRSGDLQRARLAR